MKPWMWVALGGALGSVARFKLSGWVLHYTPSWRFPVGTFVVNLLGCLLVGVLAGLSVKQNLFSPEARLFVFTGLMGGFTTFSAFGLETLLLVKRGALMPAVANVVLSVAVGLALAWAGYEWAHR